MVYGSLKTFNIIYLILIIIFIFCIILQLFVGINIFSLITNIQIIQLF
jgi:hypothetical protein